MIQSNIIVHHKKEPPEQTLCYRFVLRFSGCTAPPDGPRAAEQQMADEDEDEGEALFQAAWGDTLHRGTPLITFLKWKFILPAPHKGQDNT